MATIIWSALMHDSSKYIWVTWERQRRSVELAHALNAPLHIIDYGGIFRYLRCMLESFLVVKQERPDILFVQNPSIVLAFFSIFFLKPLFSMPVVVDRHSNFLLTPKKRLWLKEFLFNFLSYATLRYADLTIVTNKDLAHVVKVLGGVPFVLPDRIPTLSAAISKKTDSTQKILIISSFAEDEPFDEVIEAFKKEGMSSFAAFMSGNFVKVGLSSSDMPSNLTLTGFLSEDDFVDLLFNVDVVMVLTKMNYTLLCGCYEAVAAAKPLITSNTSVLRQLFTGAVFVENDPDNIAAAVREVFADLAKYEENSIVMKTELTRQWTKQFDGLKNLLAVIQAGTGTR